MDQFESDSDEILQHYYEGNWKSILRKKFQKNPYLPWLWPSEENLHFIANIVRSYNYRGIVSIGSGCGLLEWLITASTGISVRGVEVDENWWTSKYSKKIFIPTVFVTNSKCGIEVAEKDEILLFCYFNNLPAFLGYLATFSGNCFIVIGPGKDRGTHTIPNPFYLPEEIKCNWTLDTMQELGSLNDFIAVYRK